MDLKTYQKACKLTAKKFKSKVLEIATWGLGVAGEAGDIASCIKKYYAHKNKEVRDGIKENIGDMLWYTAIVCNFFGWQLANILDENYKKLLTRYPKGFTFKKAQRKMVKWSGQTPTRLRASKENKNIKKLKYNHGK